MCELTVINSFHYRRIFYVPTDRRSYIRRAENTLRTTCVDLACESVTTFSIYALDLFSQSQITRSIKKSVFLQKK
jgi:hypothetical protein